MNAVICDCCNRVINKSREKRTVKYRFSAIVEEPYLDPMFLTTEPAKTADLDICQECLEKLVDAAKEYGSVRFTKGA